MPLISQATTAAMESLESRGMGTEFIVSLAGLSPGKLSDIDSYIRGKSAIIPNEFNIKKGNLLSYADRPKPQCVLDARTRELFSKSKYSPIGGKKTYRLRRRGENLVYDGLATTPHTSRKNRIVQTNDKKFHFTNLDRLGTFLICQMSNFFSSCSSEFNYSDTFLFLVKDKADNILLHKVKYSAGIFRLYTDVLHSDTIELDATIVLLKPDIRISRKSNTRNFQMNRPVGYVGLSD